MKIYLGGAKCGKSSRILGEIKSDLENNLEKKIYILSPETKTYMYEKKFANILGNSNIKMDVISFARLSHLILKNTKYRNIEYIDDELRKNYLKTIIKKLKLNYLGKEKSIPEIITLIDKVKENKVDLKNFENVLGEFQNEILKLKLQDFIDIFKEYELRLGDLKDKSEKSEILKLAIRESEFFANSKVYILGFDGFKKVQYEILEEIASKAEIVFGLTLNNLNTSNPNFVSNKKTFANIVKIMSKYSKIEYEILEENNVQTGKLKTLNHYLTTENEEFELKQEGNSILLREETNTNNSNTNNNINNSNINNVKVYEFANKSNEISKIAYEIYKKIKEGVQIEKIQVVMNDFDNYKFQLKREFDKYGINLNLKEKIDLFDQDLIKYVIYLLQSMMFDTNSIIEFVKLSILNEELGIQDLQIYLLEKYLNKYKIDEKKIKKEFKYGKNLENFNEIKNTKNKIFKYILKMLELIENPDEQIAKVKIENEENKENKESEKNETTFELEENINFEEIAVKLEKLQTRKITGKALSKAIFWNLKINDVFEKLYQKTIGDKIAENNYLATINKFNEILNEMSKFKELEFKEYVEILKNMIAENSINKIDEKGSINFTFLDSVNLECDYTYILSMEEDVTPKKYFNKGIISEKENIELKSVGINLFETEAELEELSKIKMYNALTSPNKQLYLSYSRYNDYSATDLYPNEYIDIIKSLDIKIYKESKIDGILETLAETNKKIMFNENFEEVIKEIFMQIPNTKEMIKELFLVLNEKVLSYEKIFRINEEKTELEFGVLEREILKLIETEKLYQNPGIQKELNQILYSFLNRIKAEKNDEEKKLLTTEYIQEILDTKNIQAYIQLIEKYKYYGKIESELKEFFVFKENFLDKLEYLLKLYKYLLNSILLNTENLKIYNWVKDKNIEDKLPKELVDKIYKSDITMSISKLEAFVKFPFTYHLKYVLKIKEPKEFNISNIDTGNFLHEVIEKVFDEYTQIKLEVDLKNDYTIKELEVLAEENKEIEANLKKYKKMIYDKVEEKANELTFKEEYEVLLSTARNKKIVKKIIEDLKQVCLEIAETLRLSNYEILGNEVSVGILENKEEKQNLKYYNSKTLKVGNRKVQFNGKIDRVDQNDEGFRIIDYKSSAKELKYSQIINGIQLQLIIYSELMEEKLNKPPKGVFYFKTAREIKTNPQKIRDTREYLNESKLLNGMFIGDLADIKQMDNSLKSGKSEILKASITSKGEVSKSTMFMNTNDYDKLKNITNEKVIQLLERMLSGDISIKPFKYMKGKNSITDGLKYCPYKSIHKFGKNNTFNYIYEEDLQTILKKINKPNDNKEDTE